MPDQEVIVEVDIENVDLSKLPHPLSRVIKGMSKREIVAGSEHDHYKDKPEHDHYKDGNHEWERGV